MSIEQEIKDAIAKNLPQALGEALQQRLQQADKDAASVVDLTAKLDQSKARNTALDTKIAGLEAQLTAHGELATREVAVAKREHDADLKELQIQLAAAQGNQQFAREVALGLVRNVEYRNSVMEIVSGRAVPVPAGGVVQHSYQTETATKTTETKAS